MFGSYLHMLFMWHLIFHVADGDSDASGLFKVNIKH